jgi:hypothetical protein
LKGRKDLQLIHQPRQQGELQNNPVNVLRTGIIVFLEAGNNFVCVILIKTWFPLCDSIVLPQTPDDEFIISIKLT